MQTYKTPLNDIRFALKAVGYDTLMDYEDFAGFDLDTAMALTEQAGKFCENELLPLNRTGDEEGLHYDPEAMTVTTPAGFKALYRKFAEDGYLALTQPTEHGGSGAPGILGVILSELAASTNKSFSMVPALTHGLVDALLHHGTPAQIEAYAAKLISGEWTATMCLTEPHAGTDLGLLSTQARPEGDHYRLTGTKIWITFGEHDLTENIIHLVLARLPDAPAGIRGISLFLVPKFTSDGERNTIFCGGLEHKMGIHASPTCVMNLEDARGYLVGEPNKGMRGMFTMMNAARLYVGLEGVALSEIAYQTAVAFAKDRRQGRSLDNNKQDTNSSADNILIHPDVRRMLLNIRATTEGMRGLGYLLGLHLDKAAKDPDETTRQTSDDLTSLLTPVVKSFFTERGFLNISEAMQVVGGAGYTKDWSIEQYMRDCRIAMIYEGTNHIQALDLVGRKLAEDNGRRYRVFAQLVQTFIAENEANTELAEFVGPLKNALDKLTQITMHVAAVGAQNREAVAAIASHYLNIFALTSLAYIWAVQAKAALENEGDFFTTKLKTARYYFSHILPETESLVAKINADQDTVLSFTPDDF